MDLACGTGRIAIPLALAGFDVTGVDITPEMIAHARRKSTQAGANVRWVLGDGRTVRLPQTFRLIFMTGNAFQAFLTREDQAALLQNVYTHLQDGGIFAFEVRNPSMSELATASTEMVEVEGFRSEQGEYVREFEQRFYDLVAQVEHYLTKRQWIGADAVEQTRESRIAIRYIFPQELESLLVYNGFTLERRYGNFDGSSLTAASPLQMCICKKQG